ncbi:MAG TPA: serine/threonine-protein kinase [Anaerolineales bacterium]|nr:serine/threonine-protein kinase [Anaerolineales bacterium]
MTTAELSDSSSPLVPGGSFRQYQLLEQIGVGGQAVVWSALDQSQTCLYALKFNKILDADQTRAEEIGIEQKLEALLRLHHAHILPLREFGSEERIRFMVMPYIPGGTLAARIKTAPLSFEEVLRFGTEIASALDYLHSQAVIHRDLKSSNILMDLRQHTYLADFGLARLISTSTLAFHTGHGTPPYSPPEQVRSKEITPKSDIFSFGILLFEMFTGQLPWNGQRQLGVEQLHSDQELPDPREYVAGLPPLITDVLRRVTSADPDRRPRSAMEVMKMLYYVFNTPAESEREELTYDESAARHRDAEELLKHGLSQWESTNGKFNLGLTKFALIDLEQKEIDTDQFNRFMLAQALTYGYKDDHWWSTLRDRRERLLVASVLLSKDNEAIAARVLKHLIGDLHLQASAGGLPKSVATSLFALGTRTNDAVLRQKIFAGMLTLVRPGNVWRDPPLNPDQIKHLGVLALEDSQSGDTAAELIGHLRSPSAVQVILRHPDEGRKIDALLLIQRVAGSLPSFVPGGVRLRLSLEWVLQRLMQQPVSLFGAYLVAWLGTALGIGLQVYLTYNLPDWMDIARISTSLEQGLIIGSIFGLGIFLSRAIIERFRTSNTFLRVTFGTIAGVLGMNIALFIFHVLFLSTPPRGFLITLGCALIALTFALSSLLRSRLVKILLSSLSILMAITGTWLIHVNLAASPVELTPVFRYDYTWPLAQVIFTALVVALPIGIFGNLISLSIKEE